VKDCQPNARDRGLFLVVVSQHELMLFLHLLHHSVHGLHFLMHHFHVFLHVFLLRGAMGFFRIL
jgi:hypothetical protein